MMVNGRPTMACKRVIKGDNVRVEPHPKFKIVKDLVVDFDKPDEEPTGPSPKPPSHEINVKEDKCVHCGDCVETCPTDALKMDGSIPIVDLDSCCGVTCKQCELYCWKNAIEVRERE